MSLIIVISDGISWTEIGCGIKPRGSIRRVIAAGQIQYWDQSQFVASPNTGSTPDWPFTNGGGGGDCRFDTGSLFCFAGAPNRVFDNEEVVGGLGIPMDVIDAVTAEEKQELKRRELAYRGSYSEPEVRGKTVILIDDGIATGSTMRAAVRALNAQHPARSIVAVPTAAGSPYRELRSEVDELVALMTPERFYGVSEWYQDFSQTSDADVTDLLERARSWTASTNVAGVVEKGGEV